MTTRDVGAVNSSVCGCAEGFYLAVSPSGGKECRGCLTPGAHCPGFGTPPLLQTGFFLPPDASREAWDLDVWRCMSDEACPGQEVLSDPPCAGLRLGLNCVQCPAGFSVDGLTGCTACAAGGQGAALGFLLLGLLLAFLVF